MTHASAWATEGVFMARGQTHTEGCPIGKARLYKALRFDVKEAKFARTGYCNRAAQTI